MKKFENIEENLSGILFGVLLVILIVQIFSRQILNEPLLWSEELSRLIFVYIAILGVILGIKHNQHVAIDIIVEKLPLKIQKKIEVLANILIIITIALLFIIGVKITQRKSSLELLSLGISAKYLYGALPVGAVIMMARFLQGIVRGKNREGIK